MSRDGSIDLDFGDGTYPFRLAWGQLEKLQEACNAGPFVILGRLRSGAWLLSDLRETVRYGLVGGGMEPSRALKMVREYVEERPPLESVSLAQVVLAAALAGAPEEGEGKDEAAKPDGTSMTSPTASSDLPPSTETEQS